MSRIIFNSGYELEFPYEKWDRTIQELKQKGLRLQLLEDCMIPMSVSSIERIMKDTPVKEEVPVVEDNTFEHLVEDKQEAVEDKPDIDAEREKALADMIEKSNCMHEPDNLVLNVQETKAGPRYFHVCDFCGHRGRYEKKADLLAAGFDLDSANVWVDSD